MYKVLIVEDEAIIREGLKNNIPWKEMGFEVAGTACNGRKAVEMLENLHVEVVMTDVRMPVMDGIELAQYINEHRPEIKVIILSGYADFHYAQAAIKNNVSEYLLKPLKIEEIKNAFKRVMQNSDGADNESYEDIIMSIILENKTEKYRNIHFANPMRCAVMAIDNYRVISSLEQKQIRSRFAQFKEKAFNSEYGGFSAFIIEDSFVIMVSDRDAEEIREIFDILSAQLSDEEYDGATISCGVSSCFSNISQIKDKYLEAYQALKMRFYFGDAMFLEYSDEYSTCLLDKEDYKKYRSKEKEIIEAINGGTDNIVQGIEEMYALLSEKKYINQDIAIKLLKGIASAFSDYIMLNSAALDEVTENEMEKFTSLDNMISYLKKCAEEIAKDKSGIEETEDSERLIIKRVKKYVQENFAKKITLSDIEEKFYINKSYFSWLFGKVTGQTFTEYLTGVRMEEAKRLLNEGNKLKVYEVAESVGYSDYRNFSKIFKKATGVTPLKFKERR